MKKIFLYSFLCAAMMVVAPLIGWSSEAQPFQPTTEWERELGSDLDIICGDTWCGGDFWLTDFTANCQNEGQYATCTISFYAEWALSPFERPKYITPLMSTQWAPSPSGRDIEEEVYFLNFYRQCQIGDLPKIQADTSVVDYMYGRIYDPLGACIYKQNKQGYQLVDILTRPLVGCKEPALCDTSLRIARVKEAKTKGPNEYNFQWFFEVARTAESSDLNDNTAGHPQNSFYAGHTELTWPSTCVVPEKAKLSNKRTKKSLKSCLRQQKVEFLLALEAAGYRPKQKVDLKQALYDITL